MKFAVGDKVEVITAIHPENLGCISLITKIEPSIHFPGKMFCYLSGNRRGDGAPEHWLRELPGDSILASTLALFTKKQPNPDKVKETIL